MSFLNTQARKNPTDSLPPFHYLFRILCGSPSKFVPESLRTADICLEAVKQDGSVLELVPESLQAQVKKATGICDDDNGEDEGDNSEDPVKMSSMAVEYRDAGRYEEALVLHDKIIRLTEDAAAWRGGGWAYFLKGE